MRIRMIEPRGTTIDGVDLSIFHPGHAYEVDPSIATYLIVGPLLLLAAALCGRIARANRRDEAGAETAAPAALPPAMPRGDHPAAEPSTAADIGAAI